MDGSASHPLKLSIFSGPKGGRDDIYTEELFQLLPTPTIIVCIRSYITGTSYLRNDSQDRRAIDQFHSTELFSFSYQHVGLRKLRMPLWRGLQVWQRLQLRIQEIGCSGGLRNGEL